MRLLEYEAKRILGKYGIPLPKGEVLSELDKTNLTGSLMIKAQVPIGGRGKAGGVLVSEDDDDIKVKIDHLFSSEIRGFKAKKILVEEKFDIKQEFFMAITYDTVNKAPVAIFSSEGGVDIEELAVRQPEKVNKQCFSVRDRLPQYVARQIIAKTGISGKNLIKLGFIFAKLGDIFLDHCAVIAEINPVGLTEHGDLLALDCHIELDDDALFRNKDLEALEKNTKRYGGGKKATPFELEAARGVAGRVIEFNGDLGLIIGGGGASLTAFDAIQYHGGKPANYCEIGGNPSVLKVKALTQHILSKPGVEKIAVIMNVVSNTRVDLVARGIIKGVLEAGKKPSETIAVFRIPGAWEQEGEKILSAHGVEFCDRTVSIDEAAKIAVEKTQKQPEITN